MREILSKWTYKCSAHKQNVFKDNWLTPRVEVSCGDAADAAAVREVVGEALLRFRGLPPAGPVGGPAALDRAQYEALTAALSAVRTPDAR